MSLVYELVEVDDDVHSYIRMIVGFVFSYFMRRMPINKYEIAKYNELIILLYSSL